MNSSSPRTSAPDEIELVIDAVGGHGDGVATTDQGKVFVPFTVPGDRVRARLGMKGKEGTPAVLLEVMAAGAHRIAPPCAHFGACGGCDLQQWQAAEALDWKRAQVVATLRQRGLDAPVEPVVATLPGERRRARLSVRRDAEVVEVGFRARGSHAIIDVASCALLDPALGALLAPLRKLTSDVLQRREEVAVELTLTDSGIDLLFERSHEPTPAQRSAWAKFATTNRVARISWRADSEGEPELLAKLQQPAMTFGGISVELPPGTFLQASATAEAALVAEVVAAAGKARRVLDLYSGCGTFALPLLQRASVHALEGSAAAVAALKKAAGARLTVEQRDLERRPLQKDELKKVDFVVLDPPRAGARAQSEALAASAVPVIAYVSCNPATFARDARTLVDGGYALSRVVPVDQFLWSAHVELVGIFQKSPNGRRGR